MSARTGAAVALALTALLALVPGARAQEAKRPFAEGGLLEVPEGKEVRMGDASAGLAIVAAGGSAIKKDGLALALVRGKMGVGLASDGRRGMRVVADKVVVQTAGGKFVVERDAARVIVRVLSGKVVAAVGGGAARNLSAWQQLVVPAKGAPKLDGVPAADHARDDTWIGPVTAAPAASPAAAPAKKPARRRRAR